jgi:predicted tellurium resistance membrane protein TerC
MMARIKARAEQDGKSVSVVDGVLSVDNIAVFSLRDGKLNNSHGQPR